MSRHRESGEICWYARIGSLACTKSAPSHDSVRCSQQDERYDEDWATTLTRIGLISLWEAFVWVYKRFGPSNGPNHDWLLLIRRSDPITAHLEYVSIPYRMKQAQPSRQTVSHVLDSVLLHPGWMRSWIMTTFSILLGVNCRRISSLSITVNDRSFFFTECPLMNKQIVYLVCHVLRWNRSTDLPCLRWVWHPGSTSRMGHVAVRLKHVDAAVYTRCAPHPSCLCNYL